MPDSADHTEYRGPDISPPIGNQLQVVLGLDDRPESFGDWVNAMAYITERDGIEVDLDALCTTDDSPHRARFEGESQHYQCTQDAFIVPFLAEDIDTVKIETVSPIEGDRITIEVTETGIDVDPPSAVMSFGVAAEFEPPEEPASSPILAYSQVCPYGNAFTSTAEYERWAEDTDAFTMVVSMKDTLEFAREIGRVV